MITKHFLKILAIFTIMIVLGVAGVFVVENRIKTYENAAVAK